MSGHTHFFLFHVIFWAAGYLQFCQERRVGGPRARAHRVQHRKTSSKRAAANSVTLEEITDLFALLGYVVAVGAAYVALHATYFEGFHTARCVHQSGGANGQGPAARV